MEPMTDELKETIIREHSDGIWLVLAEENPPDIVITDIADESFKPAR